MIKIDRKNVNSFNMKGSEMTIAGELSFLMVQFIEKYGEEHFDKCVKASKDFIKEEKEKRKHYKNRFHIELINGNKKPLIIEDDTLDGAIKKINKLNIPEQVKKYGIKSLKENN